LYNIINLNLAQIEKNLIKIYSLLIMIYVFLTFAKLLPYKFTKFESIGSDSANVFVIFSAHLGGGG
jgi:hypothetical protein